MRQLSCALLLLLATSGLSDGHSTTHGADSSSNGASSTIIARSPAITSSSSAVSTAANATCRSRTANYITNTLPQQCLRTDRVAASGSKDGSQSSNSGNVTHPQLSGQDDYEKTPTTLDSAAFSSTLSSSKGTVTSDGPSATSAQSTSSITATASTTEAEATSTQDESVDQGDSPFDNANFLSFEEWKKQNLAKAGQSPENVGQGHGQNLADGTRQRPGINNALDVLGEEGEIELDFSAFNGADKVPNQPQSYITAQSTSVDHSEPTPPSLRSKDAGKTCKERTNYASFDCAATILKTNSQCKSSSSVLVENKDSYMLNPCSADNKFVIVELCNDILIDTVVLANYEFFSSIFRQFRVSVSDRYPVKMEKWKQLGTFEARNTREVQAFLVENPLIWARYLRIEFLSHYGSEYYCPLSLLRVHGTTMLEEFRHQEELSRGEHDDDQGTFDTESEASMPIPQEPILSTDELHKPTAQQIPPVEETLPPSALLPTDVHAVTDYETASSTETVPMTSLQDSAPSITSPSSTDIHTSNATDITCPWNITSAASAIQNSIHNDTQQQNINTKSSSENYDKTVAMNATTTELIDQSSSYTTTDTQTSHVEAHGSEQHDVITTISQTGGVSTTSSVAGPVPPTGTSSDAVVPSAPSQSVPSIQADDSPTSSTSTATSNIARSIVTAISAPPAQPSTQESFFKSIHKRLQQLESNSTLSLQYIEEQSRILRDAFSKVEKRQLTATSNFLTHLNETVMTELHGFRQAYDQLWQSTVIELDGQREQYQREMLALSTRLTLVADELVWQKRMGIVQSTLLLLCLGLVLFARNGSNVMEVPLYQQVVNKSQAALSRAGWETPPASPSPSSRSPASLLRRKIWRTNTDPTGSHLLHVVDSRPVSRDGPDLDVTPPTPPSPGEPSVVGSENSGDSAYSSTAGS